MAFLSSVTDVQVMRAAHLSPPPFASKKKAPTGLKDAAECGIVNQGQFESKIRCLQMFDGRLPLDKLRVWTAEQDGSLTIRKATTGQTTCTIEKKRGVYISALLYHDNLMYAGMEDGYIRVYRETPNQVISIPAGCQSGITMDSQRVITKIKLNSVADRTCLSEGMQITHVGGVEMKSVEEVKQAIAAAGKSPARRLPGEEVQNVDVSVKSVNRVGEPDFELCSEVRKHTGAVTCLAAVTNRKAGYLIFSGSRDWQIYLWRWEGTVLRAMDSFPGHQNAVRCLTYHPVDEYGGFGGFLYSGGDDFTIRCLDIHKGKERATKSGFPLTMKGSVRALAAYKKNLFSATADGLVQVWCSSEGTHKANLYGPYGGIPQAQLCLIVVNNCVWSGGVDGIIRVWRADADEHDNDWQMCELNEHKGAFCNNMSAVQGAADGNVSWLLTEDHIKLFYTESDSASGETEWNHDQGFTTREQDLIKTIEEMRAKMLENSIALHESEKLCAKLAKMDKDRKAKLALALGDSLGFNIKQKYYKKIHEWLLQYTKKLRARTLAETMAMGTSNGIRNIYYAKLFRFAALVQDRRKKMKFCELIMKSTQDGMKVIYYRKLIEYTRKKEKSSKRAFVSNMMMSCTNSGLRRVYHSKCVRWFFQVAQNRKRDDIAASLLKSTTKGMMTVYYYKLVNHYRNEKAAAKRQAIANAMLATTNRGIQLVYLQKCLRWTSRRKDHKKKKALAGILMASSNETLRRLYKKKCLDWLALEIKKSLDQKIADLDGKIELIEGLLRDSRSMSDEEIESETASLHKEMGELEQEITDLENSLKTIATEGTRLKRELQSSFSVDANLTPEEQLRSLIVHLKAHGCNCKDDYDTINQCKEVGKKFADQIKTLKPKDKLKPKEDLYYSPQKLFFNGLAKVRSAISETLQKLGDDKVLPQEGKSWLVRSDVVDLMEYKLFTRQAHIGLKHMVIAYDQMEAAGEKFSGHGEAILNQDFLVNIVVRCVERRVAKQKDDADELAGSLSRERTHGETAKGSTRSPSMRKGGSAAKVNAGTVRSAMTPSQAQIAQRSRSKPTAKKAAAKRAVR
eukprot:TRINITY_DN1131_c0_g1_i1.p1 TRINITY_DN1131_c0_g1~~TRINITY_DN1131_c0_g1_i1.p1  ORF type:complete len:1077 (+),score=290.28 TRINITY_DN1131_c0_g1_i1:38-3268(+)